jgi:hypothetical protein
MRQADGHPGQQTRGPLAFTPACYTYCMSAKDYVLALVMLPKTSIGLIWHDDGGESVAVLPPVIFINGCVTKHGSTTAGRRK